MKRRFAAPVKKVFSLVGYELKRKPEVDNSGFPADFEQGEVQDLEFSAAYTLTSAERMVSLARGVRYVCENKIPGAIVECGVWKGGSMIMAACTLKRMDVSDRELYLFDTFEGMSEPTEEDVSYTGQKAVETNAKIVRQTRVSLEAVQANVYKAGYDKQLTHFVKGKVEDTIPEAAPEKIALLRLDTDWYESTLHEMVHLWPRLSKGGVIIVDDYGHWQGARKAVDEYLKEHAIPLLLNRIDYTGRMGVKL